MKLMMPTTSQVSGGTFFIECLKTPTMLVVSASVITAGIILTAILVTPKPPKTGTGVDAFCCPNEASALKRAVNRSLDPCENFYNYVCLNTIKYRMWPFWDAKTSFEKSVATATDLQNNSAGIFLSSVFRTCVRTIWNKRNFAAQLANTIIDMGHLKRVMTNPDILLYLLETNLVFELRSAVYIRRSDFDENEIKVRLDIVHESSELYQDYKIALGAAASAFNTKFGTNVSLREVYRFATLLDGMIPERYKDEEDENNEAEVRRMNMKYWNDTLQSAGWVSLRTISKLDVLDPIAVKTVVDVIGQSEHHHAGLVFLLAHSTVYALISFSKEISTEIPQKLVFERCLDMVGTLLNLKDHMYTGILANADKERHMEDLYATVVRAMESDINSRSSFEKKDINRLLVRLHYFSFVVPSQRLVNVTIPKPTMIFAHDYFQGRQYEFHANELRHQATYFGFIDLDRPLQFVGDKYITVSPAFFNFYSFNSPHKTFLNLPSIGVEISMYLWHVLLLETPHPKKIELKIEKFYDCFKEWYYGGHSLGEENVFEVSRALAVGTVLRALDLSEWHTLKFAWSLWKLSLSQLFYVREAFYRCPLSNEESSESTINIPLSYNQDFATSFHCAKNSRMSRAGYCTL